MMADTTQADKQLAITLLPDIEKLNDSEDNENSVCLQCDTYVDDGIRYDDCHRWFHYVCEKIDSELINFHDSDQSYQCISCRNLIPLKLRLFQPSSDHTSSILQVEKDS